MKQLTKLSTKSNNLENQKALTFALDDWTIWALLISNALKTENLFV